MSDNTNLNLALWNAGIVSFNGAQLMNELAVPGELPAYTERYCREAFFGGGYGEIAPSSGWSDEPSTWWNNPEELEGAILALEIAEDLPSPTAVAGTLMAMGERGLLERFDGVLLGRVPGRSFVEEPPREAQEEYRESVREAVVDQVGRYNPGAPVVCGVDWGHTTPTVPFPIGGHVELDPPASRIAVAF